MAGPAFDKMRPSYAEVGLTALRTACEIAEAKAGVVKIVHDTAANIYPIFISLFVC
jgi:hypothetical protein